MIQFTPKKKTSIIKVIGVGGGGSNAVNHMFKEGIEGVDFVICNTDVQALSASPVPVKIQLGESGLGAGSIPERAEKAAIESLEKFEEVLDADTEMLFITAGMGGGTGTGAAPVIAKFARERGLLSVGIVTLPFRFEGRRKTLKAKQGIEEMRKYVDTLLVISNDKLRDQYGDLGLGNAFAHADNVLTTAAKGIAELITVHGYVNVDFQDVKTVMKDSGKAIMGSAVEEGEDRALKAIEEAMRSPLLNDNDVRGAKNILLYITAGTKDVTMDEITQITDYIADKCGEDSADVIWGRGIDESMGEGLGVTIIATGFDAGQPEIQSLYSEKDKKQEPSTGSSPINPDAENMADPSADARVDTVPDEKEQEKSKLVVDLTPEPKPVKKIVHKLEDEQVENPDSSKRQNVIQPELHFNEQDPAPALIKKTVKPTADSTDHPSSSQQDLSEREAIDNNSKKRIERLRELSAGKWDGGKRHGSGDFKDEEKIPAFRRQNIQLSEPNYSSQSEVSRYTLGEDSKKNPIIKSDNSFLHDNVD